MKSKSYLYSHPFKPEVELQEHLENLENMQQSAQRVCIALGLPTLMRCGRMRVILDECPVDSKHRTPAGVPHQYPLLLKSNHLYCEQGDHKIGITQMLDAFTDEPKDIPKVLAKMKVGKPQLSRFYAFETGEEGTGSLQRAVGAHPHKTLAELYITEGVPVRGVVIEAPTIELAKQLAGQAASRKKMNICESVPLRRDGTLAAIAWHRAWLAPLERLLLADQKRRDIRDGSLEREQARRIFAAQQVLKQGGV